MQLTQDQRVALAVLVANVELDETKKQHASTLKMLSTIVGKSTEQHFNSMIIVLEKASNSHIRNAIRKAKEEYLRSL